MRKRYVFMCFLLIMSCVMFISKALSANINIDTSPLINPNYSPLQGESQEDVRRPSDELPTSPAVITPRMVHDIEVMEVRHFRKKMPDGSNEYRLNRLEEKLTGRSWETLPLEDRMRRIRLASQRVALRGTSIPGSLRGNFSPKRIDNDSIPLAEGENDVGIIDGLLRVYRPDIYEAYRARKERMLEYQR